MQAAAALQLRSEAPPHDAAATAEGVESARLSPLGGTLLAAEVVTRLESLETGGAAEKVVSERELAAAAAAVWRTADAVRAGRFPPSPSVAVCGFCPFRGVCDHEVDTSGAAVSAGALQALRRATL